MSPQKCIGIFRKLSFSPQITLLPYTADTSGTDFCSPVWDQKLGTPSVSPVHIEFQCFFLFPSYCIIYFFLEKKTNLWSKN